MAEVHILLETKRVPQYDVINICGTVEDAMAVDIQFFFPNKLILKLDSTRIWEILWYPQLLLLLLLFICYHLTSPQRPSWWWQQVILKNPDLNFTFFSWTMKPPVYNFYHFTKRNILYIILCRNRFLYVIHSINHSEIQNYIALQLLTTKERAD